MEDITDGVYMYEKSAFKYLGKNGKYISWLVWSR